MPARTTPPAGIPSLGCCFTPADSKLFAQLTGFRIRSLPAPATGLDRDVRTAASVFCDRAPGRKGKPLSPACERCLRENMRSALASGPLGRRYRGRCDTPMFLLAVTLGPPAQGLVALRGRRETASGGARGRSSVPARPASRGANLRFHRATLLLRLLARHTSACRRIDQLASDLRHSKDVSTAHEQELHRLRELLRRLVSPTTHPASAAAEGTTSHPAVRSMVAWAHRQFGRPCPLQEIADELGMNPSYLSSLFSREVGLPFRSYLAMLRLQHALDLLRNRPARVSEIAAAVGYSSADRFRAAFRQWSGLSPGAWRRVFGKA